VTWVVASNQVHVAASGSNTSNYNLVAVASLNTANGYVIDLDLTIANIASSTPTFQITCEADNANPDNFLGNYVIRFDGGTNAGGTDTTVGIVDASNVQTDSPFFTAGPGLHHIKITITGGTRTATVNVDGVDQVSAPVPISDASFKTLRIYGNSSNLSTDIILDNLTVTTGGTPAINRTTLELVAVSGSKTYIGEPGTMAAVSNTASFPISTAGPFVSAATLFGFTYIIDGVNIRRLNLGTSAFVAFTESHGTAPKDGTIAAAWRGRLVIAGTVSDPQNFYASRAGDPLDWDFSQPDPTAAFVGNAAQSGKIGQPVQALIPVSDDILIIGCEQSMWAVRGDPTDGGAIVLLTEAAGISSQTAWAKAPDGSIYFVGPRGFYKINPTATTVEEVSKYAYPQFFIEIDRKSSYISMVYDADRYGMWIFITPVTQPTSATTSMFYDLRLKGEDNTGGFWPTRFTHDIPAGPATTVWWDALASDNRTPVLGGYDGGLRTLNFSNRADDGGRIDAFVVLGPVRAGDTEAVLAGTTIDQGELSVADASIPTRWNTNVTLNAGKTAYDVTQGTPTSTATISLGLDRRSRTLRQRLKGGWFSVNLNNGAANNYFSLESLILEFEPAGRNRRQR
jgi:hypothetical protein